MKTIQIYVHGENNREPKLVEVSDEASVKDVINKYQQEFPGSGNPDEVELFLEDEEDHKQKDEIGGKGGIKKKVHIHCHRCKKVSVTIEYNGQTITQNVPPSTTAKKILKKSAKEFNISDGDAADLLLKLSDGTVLQPGDHIGSFVAFPNCSISLLLTANKQVQG
ncbi:hypothetical protein [Flavihumibacter sp. ZG627]|uniref:hypothetical protein n=1 Tax=Flavihumibacter sp. ZG627 TaxID=1463156 RepID=UPI000B2EE74A|nr:hypothetical protein [Flavihumibacter sp. ZG627]